MMKRIITVRIPDSVYEKLKEEANSKGITISALIRYILMKRYRF